MILMCWRLDNIFIKLINILNSNMLYDADDLLCGLEEFLKLDDIFSTNEEYVEILKPTITTYIGDYIYKINDDFVIYNDLYVFIKRNYKQYDLSSKVNSLIENTLYNLDIFFSDKYYNTKY